MELMENFLRQVFKSGVDIQTVTPAVLRKRFMNEEGLKDMSKNDKKLFSSILKRFLMQEVIPNLKTDLVFQEKERGLSANEAIENVDISEAVESNYGKDLFVDQNKHKPCNYLKEKNVSLGNGKHSSSSLETKCEKLDMTTSGSDEEMSFKNENLGSNLVLEHRTKVQNSLDKSVEESEEDTIMQKSTNKKQRKRKRLASESDDEDCCKSEKFESNSMLKCSTSTQNSLDAASRESEEKNGMKRSLETPKAKNEKFATELDEVTSESEKSDSNSVLNSMAQAQNNLDTSSEESEEEINLSMRSQKTPKEKRHNIVSSDSEEENSDSNCENMLPLQKMQSKEAENRQNDSNYSSSEVATSGQKNISPLKSRSQISEKNKIDTSDSDESVIPEDEKPLSKIKLKETVKGADDKLKRKNKAAPKENESKSISKKKQVKTEKDTKAQKGSSKGSNRIEHLKKYIRTAGIHVQSYTKLFENCRSMKAQIEKLLELLYKEGLKGPPTLEKCKKLRKKIEKRKEVAELDIKNIIVSEGRPRRGKHNEQEEKFRVEIDTEKKFSRILDIVDSEESD